MGNEWAIEVENVHKSFRLRGGARTLKGAFLEWLRHRKKPRELQALYDIHLRVRRGEALGIIGANGAGKSTLLALLAGTLTPTRGRIVTRGVISSLLELGAGFHPDLSGRENVYLSGAIMGLSQRQIRERFDRIVAFAGLENFIDQPVKHYSTGMYVRLGFAVAVEVDPDILLIDEVLAVGDASFQRKCLARMEDFRKRGKTMLIISHDLQTIQKISDRILFLDHGKVLGDGPPGQVLNQYDSFWRQQGRSASTREWGTREALITNVHVCDAAGEICERFQQGAPLEVRISYESAQTVDTPVFGFALHDDQQRLVFGSNTQIDGFVTPSVYGKGQLRMHCPALNLGKGAYYLSVSLHSHDHKTNYHRLDFVTSFTVESARPTEGPVVLACQWDLPQGKA